MRFPSLIAAWEQAVATARRFPFVLAAGIVAAIAAIVLAEGPDSPARFESLLAASTLGLPLLFGLTVFGETRDWEARRRYLLLAAGVAALVVFGVAWSEWSQYTRGLRYAQYSIGLHLLVAFLPFTKSSFLNGLWHHNRIMLLRFLIAALFAVVLYAGLAGALLALDKLFGVDLEWQVYLRLWVVIAFVFNPWFFLGGIPKDILALEHRTEYPTGLKVFSQYILLPLVAVYVVILTLYLGKVILTTIWPSGWIGYLVSGVSVMGILSLLLVYPIRDRAENKWIGIFAKSFYFSLFPSIVMVLLAAWQRIAQYGVTEPRYFLVVLALWLFGIAIFHSMQGLRNLKMIPLSLCVVTFATSLGPWGAFSVSRRSQESRLMRLLTENEILIDGTIHPTDMPPPFEDRREISASLRYLIRGHDLRAIDRWLDGGLSAIDTITADPNRDGQWVVGRAALVASYMGVPYVSRWEGAESQSFMYNIARADTAVVISGYDYAVRIPNSLPITAPIDGMTWDLSYADPAESILVMEGGERILEIPLAPMMRSMQDHTSGGGRLGGEVPRTMGRVEVESERFRVLLILSAIRAGEQDGRIEASYISGDLYVGMKR